MANKLLKKKTVIQKVVKKVKAPAQLGHDKVAHTPVAGVTLPKGEFVATVGRRKSATARVRLYKEAGDYSVNGKVVGEYFRGVPSAPSVYNLPFSVSETLGKYAVSAKVSGSGLTAQLDAVVHGVARALVKMNPDLHLVIKKAGLLTRDDRMKETRKIGTGGKARRTKQSPKR